MASVSGAVEGTSQNLRGLSSSSVRRKPEARSECLPAVPVPTVRMSRFVMGVPFPPDTEVRGHENGVTRWLAKQSLKLRDGVAEILFQLFCLPGIVAVAAVIDVVSPLRQSIIVLLHLRIDFVL